jgi:hypothetical protein
MKDSGSLPGLEKTFERVVGPVCGLRSCFCKTKMEQAGRQGVTRHAETYQRGVQRNEPHSGGGGGEGRLTYQSGHGGQCVPSVSQVSEGFAPQATIDRQTLEVPALEGGIAALGCVAGLVIETFPGR